MEKPTIIIIAVVAVLVVAGAAAFFIASNGGDKEKVEVYRDLVVGDKIELTDKAAIVYDSDPKETTVAEFLDGLYYDDVPVGEKAKIKINSTDYDCTIVETPLTISYVLDSGFTAKSVFKLGDRVINTKTITSASLDPAKGWEEQVIEKGSYIKMDITINLPVFGNDMPLKGTYLMTVNSIDEDTGNITTVIDASVSGSIDLTLEVEKITDGKVKFKDVDEIVSMNDAMLLFAYDQLIKNFEQGDYTVVYGEKSSVKKDTEFGKREVVSQQIKLTDTQGDVRTVNCEFGVKNVLYGYTMVMEEFSLDDDAPELHMTYIFHKSTAVSTENL